MPSESNQRIAKLTPLDGVFHKIDALAVPVKPRDCALEDARGFVLAAGVQLAAARPASAIALRDGFAVRAEDIADSGPYAPVKAKVQWVEAGGKMPDGMDAVIAPDAVNESDEVTAPAGAGEGVWPAGADGEKGMTLAQAGEQLRATDIAALASFGVKTVSVRAPEILLVRAGSAKEDPALSLLRRMIEASGGEAKVARSLDEACGGESADAIVVIGGSGQGKSDASVTALARKGRVEIHGFGLQPGETAALGMTGKRPVLVVPGRLDAALAAFSVAGLRLVAKLAKRTRYIAQAPVTLSRKVSSQVGIAEFVPLARTGKDEAEPLASGTIPVSALARADGWLLVPAESEGYPAGTSVEMRLFP